MSLLYRYLRTFFGGDGGQSVLFLFVHGIGSDGFAPGQDPKAGQAILAVLAELYGNGVEGGSNGFFERLVFFAGRHGLATREGDDDECLGDVGQLLVVKIFRECDSPMNQILVSPLEVCHAGFNLTFPAGSHPDVSTFNFQLHAVSC